MKTPIDPTVADLAALLSDDFREMFEERAAIREHDAGITRAHAEALALADVLHRYSEALSSVTVFQVDDHFYVTTSEDLVREHVTKIGGEVRARRDVAWAVDEEFGGLAELVVAE